MKMYIKTTLTSILLCFISTGWGQTVVWQMRPSDYSHVERISSNLFKVVRNGKIGLLNADGTIVAQPVNDNISDLYENKALITCSDGHGERVTGCLTSDGNYYGYSTKYYTLNGQKFFSDGLLSVADENGKLGYIDENGSQIVGFDGKYSRIKPFTEGFAAVMRNKKYYLINKEGEEMKFIYGKGVGAAIAGCTNVYNGKAYVYDEYGGNDRSYFIYDAVHKSALVKTGRLSNTATDYLYCYQSVTGRTKEIPFEKMRPYNGEKGLDAIYSDGAYGFGSEGRIVVPCQFSSASQFEDGLAIVGLNGQTGILRYAEGDGFGLSANDTYKDFDEGNSVECGFDLKVPGIWRGKNVTVELKEQNGSAIPTKETSYSYSFIVKPSDSGKREYLVTVISENLRLFEGKVAYTFYKIERCSTCGKDKYQCEYNGNHPKPKACTTCGKPIGECKYHGHHQKPKPILDRCPTCGKLISECKYQGVH